MLFDVLIGWLENRLVYITKKRASTVAESDQRPEKKMVHKDGRHITHVPERYRMNRNIESVKGLYEEWYV